MDATMGVPMQREAGQSRRPDMVRLEGCSKHYGVMRALHEISLVVAEGEFVTLLGPSGSGKTTILNLIAGTVTPSSGRVFIGGHDVTHTPVEKRGLGMVFQSYALMPHMTIFENIAFPLRVRGLPQAAIERKVKEVLELVRLHDVAGRKPRQLSGGQQQRVSLARCIVYNPTLILMDEPLGALDKKLREQMQLEIRGLHKTLGVTMLYVTHDQEEALTMSDRIVLLNNGRIEQAGPPDELYFQPKTVFAAGFLGDSNLIEATVSEAGSPARLVAAAGYELRAEECAFPPGTRVIAMVRPENVSIQAGGAVSERDNVVEGTAVDTILLGSFVKHHVRLRDGTAAVVHESNRRRRSGIRPGDAVTLSWRASDLLVLDAEGQ
ncbi:MAG: ABC transporter ATP-binding protein [Hyphomicrobiales bacterium]